jgi:cytochrome P450
VPKGLAIMVDVWSIHRDKQIWGSDADAFRPERFEPEEDGARPPLAYMPFGVGPRMCIGMRFAMLEEKMAIVRVLQHFTFVATEATKVSSKLTFLLLTHLLTHGPSL